MARILIIDDSMTVARAVRVALAPDGHEVESLDFFVSLPAVLSSRPPDLILLDLEMPGISGLKVGKLIRSFSRAPIPVCVYSSRPIHELRAAALELDAVAVVEKSTSPPELRSAIRDILRNHARARLQ